MLVNLRAVAGTLGALLVALGASLLIPMVVDLGYGEGHWWSFAVVGLSSALVGAGLYGRFRPRREEELRIREGFAIVTLSWLVISLVGAVPFVLAGLLGVTDAFFETASGFTTTGATILGGENTPEIEALPLAFLFWRSLSHWLGGMGIIVLTLAILPLLGVGGMQLFKAEVSGPAVDKLTPRVADTAKRLWVIYFGLTLLLIVLLVPAMGTFDAVNHAFSTMATGGFSTLNASVGQFENAYVDWVIIVFMVLAGTSFALHYAALHGRLHRFWQSEEFRYYIGIMLAASAAIALVLWPTTGELMFDEQNGEVLRYDNGHDAARHAIFQAVAIVTSTGFGTSDYALWPSLGMTVIFLLFFTGGMAGSTGGGIKIIRIVLLGKNSFREMKRLLHPQAVLPLRLGGRVVSPEVMRNVLSFIVLYFGLIFFGTLVMGIIGLDLVSAFTASASSVGNIGPAFGTVGPAENYAHIPAVGKWVLSLLMIAGRLEIFTVLVLLSPGFWRR
jgi:trk system potassium uptake protein